MSSEKIKCMETINNNLLLRLNKEIKRNKIICNINNKNLSTYKNQNIFIFHGVGQGLFYSGHINNNSFNFVYDCGTKTKGTYLKNAIDSLPSKDIDFVAISHLHDDHINGLEYLLKTKNVKKIFLPFFDVKNNRDIFIIYLIANGISIGSFEFNFLTTVYGVQTPLAENIEINCEVEFIKEKKEFQKNLNNKLFWKFEFYNYEIENNTFLKIKNNISNFLNGNNIDDYIKNNIDVIIKNKNKIYEEENLNICSIVLLHYPIKSKECSLLTGDTIFNEAMNELLYEKLQSNNGNLRLCYLQVPHHGSFNNGWKQMSDKIKYNFCNLVISYGLNNSHNHPAGETLHDICIHDNDLIRVYEGRDYKYSLQKKIKEIIMEYFFEGKVKSIKIIKQEVGMESNKGIEFKNIAMASYGMKSVAFSKDTNNKNALIIDDIIFKCDDDIFQFISMHSKETFKVYFDEIVNDDKQEGEENTNPEIEYVITKVELIYG